ncbi:hypothetical protein BURK1_03498 [Burkholderiales bacterium]|nr:hypothetical protein BURK1_03498 [Burkholderiales bacterium]
MSDETPSAKQLRVDFVIGGAQKGGTTALDEMLRRHPGVAMARVKEPHWFDDEAAFAGAVPDMTPYHELWGDKLGRMPCGEATPIYSWWPTAAKRIRAYNPAMKWVLLLRDPASRAYSHWNMERSRGETTLPFEEALDREVRTILERPDVFSSVDSYLARGFYAYQIEQLDALFPREQVLALRSEWLRDDPTGTVGRVLGFLGVEPAGKVDPVDARVGEYEKPLDPGTREKLARFFEPDIRRLEALLDWDLSDWLS